MSKSAAALLAATILFPGPAHAGARQQAQVLMSENPEERKFQEDWGYADAVVTGDTAYLSGVVVGVRPGATSLEPAYDHAFQRLGAVLKRAGLSWDDVVDITSFHTDLTTQMPAIVAVKKKYMTGPPPAWTAIGVSRLIPDRGITEIKLVAKRPGNGSSSR